MSRSTISCGWLSAGLFVFVAAPALHAQRIPVTVPRVSTPSVPRSTPSVPKVSKPARTPKPAKPAQTPKPTKPAPAPRTSPPSPAPRTSSPAPVKQAPRQSPPAQAPRATAPKEREPKAPSTPPRNAKTGKPTTGGGHVEQGRNGGAVYRGKDNTVAHLQNGRVTEVSRANTVIRHPAGGPRTVEVHRPGNEVVVARGAGHGYVERPFTAGGHRYVQRTYVVNNAVYVRAYRPFLYNGVMLNFYAPFNYYPVGFYGWAMGPWAMMDYTWASMGDPWYGYYGPYFRPWGVYSRPSFWLTDYLIASTLQAAFQARAEYLGGDQRGEAVEGSAPMSPEVKEAIDGEVREELAEAQAEAQAPDAPPSNDQMPPSFSGPGQHLFVAGNRLEVENPATGGTCVIGEGDAIQTTGGLPRDGSPANVLVRASMGSDCPVGSTVTVPLPDLVEMHNNMRQTLERGMETLRSEQGTGNLPTLPPDAAGEPVAMAFAASLRADPEAVQVIASEARQADQIEQEVLADARTAGVGAVNPPEAGGGGGGVPNRESRLATVRMGLSESQVIGILGPPLNSSFLGGLKKVYEYNGGKVVFTDGEVSNVELSDTGAAPQNRFTVADNTPNAPAPGRSGNITEGLSESEVIAILGQPLRTSFLGGLRKMYEYKDRKVVFVDGNVSEVQ